jgi:AcrR family transcriptional regulator
MLGTPNVDRQSRRRADTRREILAAAWEVVHEHGWQGLTLRLVADRVGMRAPSLYSHFSSKLAIVDAMFGQAWEGLDERALQQDLPDDPREALHLIARVAFGYFTADPERHALMNQRPVPGFTPSEEAYAPAIAVLTWLEAALRRLGIDDPAAADLWTALMTGMVNQQLANDPGGDRWARLLPRAVDMYADELGIPRPTSRPPARRESSR